MMKRALLAAAMAAAAATAAHAIDVSKKVEIDGEAKEVWAKIGGFCAIKEWHPALSNCEESNEAGVTRRVLTLKDGGQIKEKLTGTTETGYSYVIEESPLPVSNYSATFAIVPDDDDKDEVNVSWTAKFDAKGKPDDEAKKVIEGVFEGGLKSIDDNM